MIMSRPFNDIRIIYDGLGLTTVSWILDSRFDDPFPHNFELQLARSATGFTNNEYVVLDSQAGVTFLKDKVFRDAGISSTSFYRVKLTTPAGTYLSSAKGLTGNVKPRNVGILRELLRKEHLVLSPDRGAIVGRLFKRRYYGPTCSCVDKNSGTSVAAICPNCFGVGYLNGYFPGVYFPVLIMGPEEVAAQISPVGIADVRSITARCLAFPPVDSKDIWMEEDTSLVYEIAKYSIVSRYSFEPVATTLEMRALPMADTVALLLRADNRFSVGQGIGLSPTGNTALDGSSIENRLLASNSGYPSFTVECPSPTAVINNNSAVTNNNYITNVNTYTGTNPDNLIDPPLDGGDF